MKVSLILDRYTFLGPHMIVPDVLVSDPSPPCPPVPQVPLIVKSEPQEYFKMQPQPSTTNSSQTESSSSKKNRNNNNVIENLDMGKNQELKIHMYLINNQRSAKYRVAKV